MTGHAGRFAILLVLAVTCGCGEGQGTVSGDVLFNGKALPGGVVAFRPTRAGQNIFATLIDE
jgi:hypothetical protein